MIKIVLTLILYINSLCAITSDNTIDIDLFFKINYNCKMFSFVKDCSFLKKFYLINHHAIWVSNDGLNENAKNILHKINNSFIDGINPSAYNLDEINNLITILNNPLNDLNSKNVTLQTLDVLITDKVYNYENDLYSGVLNYNIIFPFWKNVKTKLNMFSVVYNTSISPDETIDNITPKYHDYSILKKRIEYLRQIIKSDLDLSTIKWQSSYILGTKNIDIKNLQKKLQISGEFRNQKLNGILDKETQNAIILFQQNNGLIESGNVDAKTLEALNLPIQQQIKRIELNMDIMRQFPDKMENSYILVNLPEYNLYIINDNKVFLTMDVAVGGKDHPSCILNSDINSLIINPYWYIPYNIASTEVLNILKKNPDYINDKKIDVLKKNSKGFYILQNDQSIIDWTLISHDDFKYYKLRQRPSDINALGKVKFLFNNSCGIFLHSTNQPDLFEAYQRAFSHGCIRVSQPLNLTTFILSKQLNWNIKMIKDAYNNETNKRIKLDNPIKLYVTYLTVFVNNNKYIQYRNDIYNLESSQLTKFP